MGSDHTRPKVAIIGAGVSGLRCATVLLEHGVDVTILEARNRVGGRIAQSSEMGELDVDIGANWVHSTDSNPIVKLAKETGTPLHLWKENTLMLDTTGELINADLANRTLNHVWRILEQSMDDSKTDSGTLSPTYSLFDHFVRICDEEVEDGKISSHERELTLKMAEMWGAYVGDRVERQSMKFFFLEDCIDGGDRFIPTNYRKIVEKIAEVPIQKGVIRFGSVMKSITSDEGIVVVTTTDGAEQRFDSVVVTVPLGWIKNHRHAIAPLEPRVSEAINSISFGRLEKVLIEFPRPFWEDTEHAVKEDEDAHISFVHWLSPSYASDTNPERWRLECVSFNAFDEPYRRSILLFYTYGDCSTHITKSIVGLQKDDRREWLRRFFAPYYSRLPNYDEATCAPLKFLATTWSQDEFSGYGSYSNFQIGMQDAARDVETMRHGMPQHGIYFAGEYTAPFDGLGTVAGAYTSGEKVAHRIIAAAQGSPNGSADQ